MKTPEEILKEKLSVETMLKNSSDYTFFKVIEAMQEVGTQCHNEAIKLCADKIVSFYGDKGLTNTGNRIKEECLKELK